MRLNLYAVQVHPFEGNADSESCLQDVEHVSHRKLDLTVRQVAFRILAPTALQHSESRDNTLQAQERSHGQTYQPSFCCSWKAEG